jgi:hypothetical protein
MLCLALFLVQSPRRRQGEFLLTGRLAVPNGTAVDL